MKLRASIADLSEENARDMKEVKFRGLEGGINLVRGLREEIRDVEYDLSEARRMKTVCKAKITMILKCASNQEYNGGSETIDEASDVFKSDLEHGERVLSSNATTSPKIGNSNEATDANQYQYTDESRANESVVINHLEIDRTQMQETSIENNSETPSTSQTSLLRQKSEEKPNFDDPGNLKNVSASRRIATGDSQAIAIIQPGNKGFFTVDLWEVLLRIIGYERAANRRSVQNATKTTSSTRPNVMII